jgi:ATP-dependent Lhr-like helicase
MVEEGAEPVTVLYITPLRALINDIYRRIDWWASRLGFIVARKHGDVPHSERTRRLRKAPHILVTTPESLEIDLDWATRFREYYRNLKWVIVDEAHEIVSNKRGVQLAILLERFRRLAGDFQVIVLSATIGAPLVAGRVFAGSSRRKLRIVAVNAKKKLSIEIDAVNAPSTRFWRAAAEKLANYMEPLTIVFVNSKFVAENLHRELEKMGIEGTIVHHASISAQERHEIEEKAKEGKLNMIIATKTLELGIDIGNVSKVILFRPAGQAASLIQRLGRSGHSLEGVVRGVIIATDEIELLEAVAEARLAARGEVEAPQLPEKPLDMAARALIGMALSGMYTVDEAYDILSKVAYFRSLTREEFDNLVEYLRRNKMIKIVDGNKLAISAQFYKIWRFNVGESRFTWWVRNFSEFFTTMGERKSFLVKTNEGKVIGELDSDFVVRTLRVGHVIRLGGKNWQIVNIDEHTNKVVVVETDREATSTPFWRGKGPETSQLVLRELAAVLKELHTKGSIDLPPEVKLLPDAERTLKQLIEEVKKHKYPYPRPSRIILERVGDEEVYVMLNTTKVVRTLAYIAMLEAYRTSSNVYVKISHYGFAMPSESGVNPIELLKSLSREEFYARAREAAARSPYFVDVAHNIQLVFGITHRVKPSDGLAYEEALRQTLREYFDVQNAWLLVEKLKQGRIMVVPNIRRTSVYTREIVREAPEKPWLGNLDEVIAETLRGMAFTVEELADALGVPEKLVEAKLREMSKPGSRYRVFSFVDVDTGETRCALVTDAAQLARSEEFSASFTPPNRDALYMLFETNLTNWPGGTG